MDSLKETTVLITGATDGLGKLVVQRARAAGATLILHGRNENKGVTVNSLHPATLMNTNMVHDFFGKVNSTIEERQGW